MVLNVIMHDITQLVEVPTRIRKPLKYFLFEGGMFQLLTLLNLVWNVTFRSPLTNLSKTKLGLLETIKFQ